MDTKIVLSKVPKIKYINIEVKKTLTNIPGVLINIILEYFYKCIYCNNYFEETISCICEKGMCKYCKLLYKYCKDCINNPNNKNKLSFSKIQYTCLVKDCKNKAVYGSIEVPYYCRAHSKSKLLISYTYICYTDDCYNIGIYIDTQWFWAYCVKHKNNKCGLILSEGITYKNKCNTEVECYSCLEKHVVTYMCSCNKNRCIKCTRKYNFGYKIDDKVQLGIKCNMCAHTISVDPKKKIEKIKLRFDQFCGGYQCANKCYWYDIITNNYFCNNCANDMIRISVQCQYSTCGAIATHNKFCDHHFNELQKYKT